MAQPIVVNHISYTKDKDITSPLSTGVSPSLPPFDHARLRELSKYKSYEDEHNDDYKDNNADDYNDIDNDGVPTARVVDDDDDGGGNALHRVRCVSSQDRDCTTATTTP